MTWLSSSRRLWWYEQKVLILDTAHVIVLLVAMQMTVCESSCVTGCLIVGEQE